MSASPLPAVLDHVAIGLADVGPAARCVVGELGAEPAGAGPGVGFRFWQYAFAKGGRLELLEPDGPPGGFLHRFLASPGPGIHHVTFKVPSLVRAIETARVAGYEPVGISTEWPAWKEAFLHPKQAQGIVVQLAEEHPELEPDDLPRFEFPPAPPRAPSPARLVGVRLRARSAERARAQWRDLLGGREQEERPPGDALVFHWAGSPLRVAVELAPEAEEAPLGLELSDAPDGALGLREALGTRLLRA